MKKLKSCYFWLEILSFTVLLISLAGEFFGFRLIDRPAANEIIAAICGLLFLIGVASRNDGGPPDADSPENIEFQEEL